MIRKQSLRIPLFAAPVASLACLLAASAQKASPPAETGFWRPASNTARSITGEIAFSGEKLAINLSTFTIAQIRPLTPAEGAAAFDVESGTPGAGNLYRLSVPADKRFLHHNTLCGSDETTYMVTFVSARTLHVDFFSSAAAPLLTQEALANSSDLCGTYSYTR